MSTAVLQNMVAGFDHEAYGSQAVFRTALEALSHPGRPLNLPLQTALPQQGHAAAAALLLGLVDADTALWLSPALLTAMPPHGCGFTPVAPGFVMPLTPNSFGWGRAMSCPICTACDKAPMPILINPPLA